MTSKKIRRPRGPGVVYGVLSLVLLLVVGVLALSAAQPPPPTIAEFAPQAVEQITDAPNEQASSVGGGKSVGCGTTVTCDEKGDPILGPGTTPPPIDVPRLRKCVGEPPRQIDDPQSPPCVPYWDGDNGGATWRGVTRDQIIVAIPSNEAFKKEYEAFFNRRFEFYGRKLKLVTFNGGEGSGLSPKMISNAVAVDEQIGAFASTMYGDADGREYVFYDELARRKILTVNSRPTNEGEEHFRKMHPYQWGYIPGFDQMSRNKADMTCRMLKGKPAAFAGGVQKGQQRKFATVLSISKDGTTPDLTAFNAVLSGCGVSPQRYDVQRGDGPAMSAQAKSVVAQMQSENLTTVLCECHASVFQLMMDESTKIAFFPEWIVGNYGYANEEIVAQAFDASQVPQVFGLYWWSKQVLPSDSPWYWALKEVDPKYTIAGNSNYYQARWLYTNLLVLAAGIQMAGPNLTPSTFGTGLQKAVFPNPASGQSPYWQGKMSFQNDHIAVEDAAMIWMSRTERSSWDNGLGANCYRDKGVRFKLGSWPSDYGSMFSPPCY